jgi:hypothetical protein
MFESTPKNPIRRARRRRPKPASSLPPIVCERCGDPVIRGQHVGPLFSAKLVRWSEHPVLSKPPVIRGIISIDGSPGRVDMPLGDQLRQRAAMGGERERAELAVFEALLSKCIADALVAQVRKEAEAHGVVLCAAQLQWVCDSVGVTWKDLLSTSRDAHTKVHPNEERDFPFQCADRRSVRSSRESSRGGHD